MGIALRCTSCSSTSITSLSYLGPEAHVCRLCGAPFELADPAHDRRADLDRRRFDDDIFGPADWRSGDDRRSGTGA